MNIGPYKFDRLELAGGFGDIGTLIPLSIGLVTICGLDPSFLFLSVGIANILTGLYYRVSIPIQPMKAIAGISIAMGFSNGVVSSAGIWIALILLFLAYTNLLDFLNRFITKPIVRGIQFAVGVLILIKGIDLVLHEQPLYENWAILLSVSSMGILLLFINNKKIPVSLILVFLGITLSLFFGSLNKTPVEMADLPKFFFPSQIDFIQSLLILVPAQIFMTLGNSIIATKDTAETYFKENAKRVTLKSLATSIGLFNLLIGFLGGMPICHGSSGVTAHYRFGAKTGGANIIFGSLLVIFSLVLGPSLPKILNFFPYSILGILIGYVGIRHAMLIKDIMGTKELLKAAPIALFIIIYSIIIR